MNPGDRDEHDRRSYDVEIAHLKGEIAELRSDIKDLVEAWNAAKGMTTFIKWLASIAAAVVMLYNLYQHGGPK